MSSKRVDAVRIAVAVALAVAAGLHVVAANTHAPAGWLHAGVFGTVSLLQGLAAVVIWTGGGRRELIAIAAGIAAVLGAWALSRTVGLPVIASTPAPVGLLDAAAAAAGMIALTGLLVLAAAEPPRRHVAGRAATAGIGVLAMMTFTTGVAGAFDPTHAAHRAHSVHGGGPIATAIAEKLGDAAHVHGLGGPDLDRGPSDATPARRRNVATGALPSAVLAAGDGIWVANRGDGTLSRVDPVALSVRTVEVGGTPAALAHGFGSLWVADFRRDVVLRVDPQTGASRGAPIAVGPGPAALAVGWDGMWVASVQEGTVQRIDPRTSQPGEPIPVGYGPVALAATDDVVWVLNALDRAMVRVDQDTGRVGEPIPVPAGAADLLVAFDRLWVASASSGSVSGYHPVTGRRMGPHLVVDDTTDAGLGPTGLAASADLLWVVNNHDKTVRQIDPGSLDLTAPRTFSGRLGTGPIAVRATFAFDALWVTDFDTGGVARIEVLP